MHNDAFASDAMLVAVLPRATGIDVHKMQVTVWVRLCVAGQAEAQVATRVFETHPAALQAMTGRPGGGSGDQFAGKLAGALVPSVGEAIGVAAASLAGD